MIDRLGRAIRVAGGIAVADKEADMANDTVTNLAKTG